VKNGLPDTPLTPSITCQVTREFGNLAFQDISLYD